MYPFYHATFHTPEVSFMRKQGNYACHWHDKYAKSNQYCRMKHKKLPARDLP
jgi:uncharacterized protein YodC (DUF2158 family)